MIYRGRLGKQPKREDSRTLKLAKYIDLGRLTLPPAALDWSKRSQYPMYRNDEVGNCTCAAAGHCIQDWTDNSGQKFTILQKEIDRAYESVNGGDPQAGAVMLDVLTLWRNIGIGDSRIHSFCEVDTKNIIELEMALHWFGGLYVGLALPVSAQNQEVWDIPPAGPVDDGAPYTWGGHAVHLHGYDAGWPSIVTWGQKQRVTWQWLLTYCDEAWAVLSKDWIDRAGLAPNGFRMQELTEDLAKIDQLSK